MAKTRPTRLPGHLFTVGTPTITPAAADTIASMHTTAETLVDKHARGEWGVAVPELQRRNAISLHTGGRVISAFRGSFDQIGLEVVIETDVERCETSVLTAREWQAREYANPPERADPHVVSLMAQEAAVGEELTRLRAAVPHVELAQARADEHAAQRRVDALTIDEATGKATAAELAAAERDLADARARRETLARKVTLLQERAGQLEAERDQLQQAAKLAEERARTARLDVERYTAGLIRAHEQDAQKLRDLGPQVRLVLMALRDRCGELQAVGARPNPQFGADLLGMLQAVARGEHGTLPAGEPLWLER